MRGTRRARRFLPWLAVLAGYAGSRIFYWKIGIGFDDHTLTFFWQYLDLDQLQNNLWQAVYYQHTQPPLYNLYLGLGLELGSYSSTFFHASAIGFGLALHLGVFALARRLAIRPWLAALSTIAFAFNPASILVETWLFYTYPVASLVVISAVFLHRGLTPRHGWALFFALTVMALVVLTRSLFHLAWMIAAILIVLAFARHRGRALLIAIVPLALASSVYVKNWVVFGRPVASTWMGFSLSRLTTTKLNPLERAELVREGELSDLSGHLPWLPITGYPREYREVPEQWRDIPVLAEPRRSNGNPNFNHGAYVHIAEVFGRDARVTLARVPEVYLESVEHAWQLHFLPIHDYSFFHDRRRAAGPWMRRIESVYETAVLSLAFAKWSWEEPMPPLDERPGWGWAVLTLLGLVVALRVAWQRRRARATTATLLYCAFTIVFVAVVGNSLELGENNRFRFLSEPLTWVLVTLMIDRALAVLARARRRGGYAMRRITRRALGRSVSARSPQTL